MWGVVSMFVIGSEQCLLQIEALYLRRGWRFAAFRKQYSKHFLLS